jgi:selenocysteine-specific elongation factor
VPGSLGLRDASASGPTTSHVVGTAGHVDHGKSTLVRALTGMDPDRLAEEKARGLTIDLGFAWTTLPSGRTVSFVDVPGHIRFLKNMLAGVGAVDACLFVIAANEGWKPQSEEHLRILELLGVGDGIVVVTKVALVDDERRQLARLEIAECVSGTFLADAEVVEVDTPSGDGMANVVQAVERLLTRTPVATDRGRPRLWVDRAFAAAGAGTVVTGTLTGGKLRVDDELVLVPRQRRVRVRALQSCQQARERVPPGSRVAVNLAGVHRDDVRRGDALVRPGQWEPATVFDASLTVLASLEHVVSRRGAYQAHIGSGEYPVQLRVLTAGGAGRDSIAPGDTGFVRLHVPVPLPLLPSDRFVLRESGRSETVGGGEILDVAPALPASRARPSRSVDRVIAERGWIEPEDLERLTGERRPPTVEGWVVDPGVRQAVEDGVRARLAGAGTLGLDVATLSPRERAVLATLEGIVVDGGRARRPDAVDSLAAHPYLTALAGAPFTPPGPGSTDRGELRELVRRGLIVERDGAYFSPEAVAEAGRRVAALLAQHPGGVTVSEVRDELGTTRKHALPLLAHLDATGVTRRRGDLRIGGPRLPSAADAAEGGPDG